MKRWNGWGEETVDYPLPVSAQRYLEARVGPGLPPQDARLEACLSAVPPSRLPAHPRVSTLPLDRLLHACGHSMPDWIALRSGQGLAYPDGVAYPEQEEQVLELIQYARQVGASLIPYGGGTSVVGHINPLPGPFSVLTVDLGRMNQLYSFDQTSLLATFEAGVAGPVLEACLRAHGCTLGHFPQSFEYSTLGGWVATRSSGQQSLGYGRIDDLFAGGRLVSPAGILELPSFPGSAAGPDIHRLILGSEGRLGILTRVTVRASRLPEREEFHGVFFPDFERGQEAVRQMLQYGLPLSMLRLSTPAETATTLALAGHDNLIGALENLLALRGLRDQKCLLLVGITGRDNLVRTARREALDVAERHGGVHVGKTFGNQWHKSRFRTPYLRNTLWERGFAVDTVETAVEWSVVPHLVDEIEVALQQTLAEFGESVHVFTHLSRIYASGSSVYTTFLFRLAADPQETLQRWKCLKEAASRVILAHGGTISHQHGVGLDHRPYLVKEKGSLGIAALRSAVASFDPDGMMNPGKLI